MAGETFTQEQTGRFSRLVWPLRADVLRFARFLTRHDQEAEDLAQETLMRALRAIDTFEEDTNARAWLFTIARRILIDHRRVRKNRRLPSLDHENMPEPAAPADASGPSAAEEPWDQPEDLMRRFNDREVIDALGRLPDEIRWTLLLVDVEQMEQAEAAGILEVPTGTIKSRAHRGRRMLRDALFDRARRRGWVPNKETTPS